VRPLLNKNTFGELLHMYLGRTPAPPNQHKQPSEKLPLLAALRLSLPRFSSYLSDRLPPESRRQAVQVLDFRCRPKGDIRELLESIG
jgi:hypothetical protein